jgi:hypothetical protein
VRVRGNTQNLVAAFALLDQMELSWTKSFKNACTARPVTPATRERVTCLLGMRDRLDTTTSRMTDPAFTPGEERVFPIGELLRCDGVGIPQKLKVLVPQPPRTPEAADPPDPPDPPDVDKLELELEKPTVDPPN